MSDNISRLLDIISDQLNVELEEIKLTSNFIEELGADSLDVVELVMAIENEFDLTIDDAIASEIQTVQDALNYIERK
jgi:acyl carrier protein